MAVTTALPSQPRAHPAGAFVGSWAWLFPATYLVHIAEEYAAGEGFPAWLSRVAGIVFTPGQFFVLNAAFWLAMVSAVALARSWARGSVLLVALGTLVLLNTVLHTGGTLYSGTYSPGLLSAVLLWLPLGCSTLLRARVHLPRRSFALGVVAGFAGHALVSWLALNLGRWFPP